MPQFTGTNNITLRRFLAQKSKKTGTSKTKDICYLSEKYVALLCSSFHSNLGLWSKSRLIRVCIDRFLDLVTFWYGFVNVCFIYQLWFNQIRVSVLKEGMFEKTADLGFSLYRSSCFHLMNSLQAKFGCRAFNCFLLLGMFNLPGWFWLFRWTIGGAFS